MEVKSLVIYHYSSNLHSSCHVSMDLLIIFDVISDQQYINHPVHFISKQNKLSPSAFIPLCEFGGNMSSVGIFIDSLNFFLCNSFQTKVLNDQLCYGVDLNMISNRDNIENELKTGFVFIMDYNEDRQVTFDDQDTLLLEPDTGLASRIIQEDENKHAVIYLDTIGTDYNI